MFNAVLLTFIKLLQYLAIWFISCSIFIQNKMNSENWKLIPSLWDFLDSLFSPLIYIFLPLLHWLQSWADIKRHLSLFSGDFPADWRILLSVAFEKPSIPSLLQLHSQWHLASTQFYDPSEVLGPWSSGLSLSVMVKHFWKFT